MTINRSLRRFARLAAIGAENGGGGSAKILFNAIWSENNEL